MFLVTLLLWRHIIRTVLFWRLNTDINAITYIGTCRHGRVCNPSTTLCCALTFCKHHHQVFFYRTLRFPLATRRSVAPPQHCAFFLSSPSINTNMIPGDTWLLWDIWWSFTIGLFLLWCPSSAVPISVCSVMNSSKTVFSMHALCRNRHNAHLNFFTHPFTLQQTYMLTPGLLITARVSVTGQFCTIPVTCLLPLWLIFTHITSRTCNSCRWHRISTRYFPHRAGETRW